MTTPEYTTTSRGFKHFKEVPSTYGGHVRLYESSAAGWPHVWLATVCPASLNDPTGPGVEAVAHLTLEDAEVLRDQLSWAIAHHYQVETASGAEDADEVEASKAALGSYVVLRVGDDGQLSAELTDDPEIIRQAREALVVREGTEQEDES
jgi:hypothetical protein